MIEEVAGQAVAVPTHEGEAGGGNGNGEGEGVGVRARHEGRAGVYEQLVGEGGEGGEDTRAADDDAVGGVADLVEGDLVAWAGHVAACLVDGGLYDGVGEREITPRRLLLEGHEVLRSALVPVCSPFVGAAREAGEGHVEIVGRAPHDAHAELGEALEAGVTALEVGPGARNDVARIHRVRRLR